MTTARRRTRTPGGPRARRRPDRRRRAVRHRRGLPAARAPSRRSVALLEARDASGGTWDLFRYPGIRSDSDMFTFGFALAALARRPGAGRRAEDPRLPAHRGQRVRRRRADPLPAPRGHGRAGTPGRRAGRSSDRDGETGRARSPPASSTAARGYYDTTSTPSRREFPGADEFAGDVVHPQHWPDDLDCAGQDVVVIGSGATAMTLVPAMAETRRATSRCCSAPRRTSSACPGRDPVARRSAWLPTGSATGRALAKTILVSLGLLPVRRRRPGKVPTAHPQAGRGAAPRGVRRRPPLPAALRPVGPAGLLRPGRRPVPCAPPRPGRGGHRHDRDLHRDRHPARLGPRAPGRRHRHRDRLQLLAFGDVELVVDGRPSTSRSLAYRR